MATLGDEIMRVTGGPTVADGLAVWYGQEQGKESLQDAERRFLLAQLGQEDTSQPINDLWMQFMGADTVDACQIKYWGSQ